MNFHHSNQNPETALWRAVLFRAMKDGLKVVPISDEGSDKYKNFPEYRYFTDMRRNFCDVCVFAGLDPEKVRETFLSFAVKKRMGEPVTRIFRTPRIKDDRRKPERDRKRSRKVSHE
nr:hypothetical protein 25 [bacterium]